MHPADGEQGDVLPEGRHRDRERQDRRGRELRRAERDLHPEHDPAGDRGCPVGRARRLQQR